MQTRVAIVSAALVGPACAAPPPAAPVKGETLEVAGAPAPIAAKSAPEPAKAPDLSPPTEQATPAAPAAPEAPRPPDAAPTAPVAVPFGVYAASIGFGAKEWSVDIINFEGLDIRPLEKRLSKLEEREEDAFIDEFKPGASGLPVGFKHDDPWTLITLEGNELRRATGFHASIPGGSTALHFGVRLGPGPAGSDAPDAPRRLAIALRGHTPAPARLVAPAPIAPAALAEGTLKRVVQALLPRLDPDLRDHAKKAKIREEDVKLFPGRFPGGRSHVVFVDAEAKGADPEDLVNVSGVLLARPDGAIEFVSAAGVWGEVTFHALVDLDGDGLDEVIYEDQYHEGWYLEMLHWKDGKPESRTLMGDGV